MSFLPESFLFLEMSVIPRGIGVLQARTGTTYLVTLQP